MNDMNVTALTLDVDSTDLLILHELVAMEADKPDFEHGVRMRRWNERNEALTALLGIRLVRSAMRAVKEPT